MIRIPKLFGCSGCAIDRVYLPGMLCEVCAAFERTWSEKEFYARVQELKKEQYEQRYYH